MLSPLLFRLHSHDMSKTLVKFADYTIPSLAKFNYIGRKVYQCTEYKLLLNISKNKPIVYCRQQEEKAYTPLWINKVQYGMALLLHKISLVPIYEALWYWWDEVKRQYPRKPVCSPGCHLASDTNYPPSYHQTTKQLLSSGCETPQLIINTSPKNGFCLFSVVM